MKQVAPTCTKLHQPAPSCTKLPQAAPSCTNLHQVAPTCTKWHQPAPSCTKLHQLAPSCSNLHQCASTCTMLHQSAPSCTCTKLHEIIIILFNIYKVQINIQEDIIKCTLHIKTEYEVTVTYLQFCIYNKMRRWIRMPKIKRSLSISSRAMVLNSLSCTRRKFLSLLRLVD